MSLEEVADFHTIEIIPREQAIQLSGFLHMTWVIFGAAFVNPAFEELDAATVAYAVLSLTIVRMVPVAIALIVGGIITAGYFFGSVPWVKANLDKIIWAAIIIPGLLVLFGAWKAKRRAAALVA